MRIIYHATCALLWGFCAVVGSSVLAFTAANVPNPTNGELPNILWTGSLVGTSIACFVMCLFYVFRSLDALTKR